MRAESWYFINHWCLNRWLEIMRIGLIIWIISYCNLIINGCNCSSHACLNWIYLDFMDDMGMVISKKISAKTVANITLSVFYSIIDSICSIDCYLRQRYFDCWITWIWSFKFIVVCYVYVTYICFVSCTI